MSNIQKMYQELEMLSKISREELFTYLIKERLEKNLVNYLWSLDNSINMLMNRIITSRSDKVIDNINKTIIRETTRS